MHLVCNTTEPGDPKDSEPWLTILAEMLPNLPRLQTLASVPFLTPKLVSIIRRHEEIQTVYYRLPGEDDDGTSYDFDADEFAHGDEEISQALSLRKFWAKSATVDYRGTLSEDHPVIPYLKHGSNLCHLIIGAQSLLDALNGENKEIWSAARIRSLELICTRPLEENQ